MSNDRGGKISFHIDKSDLLCKNSCGFYGNPAWQGYCSKCYRDIGQKPKHSETKSYLTRTVSEPISGTSLTFNKFDEKRRQHFDKRVKTVKSIFKKTNSTKESSTPPPLQTQRQTSFESQQAGRDFAEYLKTLPVPATQEINKEIRLYIDRVYKKIDIDPIERIAEITQELYRTLQEKMSKHSPFKEDASQEMLDKLLNFTERYVMTTLYKVLFCPATTDDEEHDLAAQKLIRSLNWIQARHLDVKMSERNPIQRDLLDQAITALIEMDSKRAPQDKLECVIHCSKLICAMLDAQSQGVIVSADDFLPSIIFVTLRANPPMVHSNLNFILRFTVRSRLHCGEPAYYFTNLCCALQYIQKNINAKATNVSEEEFRSYTSGEAVPPGSYPQLDESVCEAVRIMNQNTDTLDELKRKQDKLQSDAMALQNEMLLFKDIVTTQIQDALDKYPWTVVPRKVPTNIDSENTECTLLPEPLQPQVVSSAVLVKDVQNVDVNEGSGSRKGYSSERIRDPLSPTLDVAANLPPPLLPEVVAPAVNSNNKH